MSKADKEKQTEDKVEQVNEFESLILISPSGHKYELTVSDSGNLKVTYRPKEEKANDDR